MATRRSTKPADNAEVEESPAPAPAVPPKDEPAPTVPQEAAPEQIPKAVKPKNDLVQWVDGAGNVHVGSRDGEAYKRHLAGR